MNLRRQILIVIFTRTLVMALLGLLTTPADAVITLGSGIRQSQAASIGPSGNQDVDSDSTTNAGPFSTSLAASLFIGGIGQLGTASTSTQSDIQPNLITFSADHQADCVSPGGNSTYGCAGHFDMTQSFELSTATRLSFTGTGLAWDSGLSSTTTNILSVTITQGSTYHYFQNVNDPATWSDASFVLPAGVYSYGAVFGLSARVRVGQSFAGGGQAEISLSFEELCGNGTHDGGEQCDDGNIAGGDCCSSTCAFEGAGSDCDSDGDACTDADSCDGAGTCIPGSPLPDGSSCADGSVCNGHETCSSAVCTSGSPLVCNNGDVCDGIETCDDVLGCQDAPDLDCNDGNECTVDGCDPVLGCQSLPNENECNVGTASCWTNGICVDGLCVGGGGLCVDDGDPCTDQFCNPHVAGSGCSPVPNDQCDDVPIGGSIGQMLITAYLLFSGFCVLLVHRRSDA